MTELKLCPFCSSTAQVVIKTDAGRKSYDWRYIVRCVECQAECQSGMGEESAIEKWNTRPIEDRYYLKVKELEIGLGLNSKMSPLGPIRSLGEVADAHKLAQKEIGVNEKNDEVNPQIAAVVKEYGGNTTVIAQRMVNLKAELERLDSELHSFELAQALLTVVLEDTIARCDKPCVSCGSTDRSLDIDFHCSTCYRNLEDKILYRTKVDAKQDIIDEIGDDPQTLTWKQVMALYARAKELKESLRIERAENDIRVENTKIADAAIRNLREALHNLVEACFRADNEGDLSSEIDGSLMSAAWEALK
jgi:hypothetical protein